MNEARAPTDEKVREQVLSEYRNGAKPTALAKKTGISVNTIKSWIKRDKAKKEKSNADSSQQKEGAPAKRKKGAPFGNKNAVGAGAPTGNKNALKHGGYAAVYWDAIDEEEMDIVNGVPDDEEELLLEQIALFSIRERRLLKAIAKYRDAKGGQYIAGVTNSEDKRKFKDAEEEKLYNDIVTEKVKNKERLPGHRYSIQTNTSSTIDLISRLERELTSVQSKKTKAIESLAKLRLEKQKIEGESKGNEFVRTWAESVLKSRREQHGK